MGALDYAARVGHHKPSSLEYRVNKEEKFLLDVSRGIDRIDPYVGVGASLLVATDNEILAGAGIAANVVEALIFKLPFITRYYAHTKNVKGTALLTAKMCLTTFIPSLAWLQLLPTNYWMMQHHLSKPYAQRQSNRRGSSLL